jgi:hypothetical protein
MGTESSIMLEQLEERLRNTVLVQDCGCWIWTAYKNHDGYGRVNWCGKKAMVQRLIRHLLIGDIPITWTPDTELDHANACCCVRRDCVNPSHVVPGTHLENIATGNSPTAIAHRTGLCKNGHDITIQGSMTKSPTSRTCRICFNIYHREYRQLKKAAS